MMHPNGINKIVFEQDIMRIDRQYRLLVSVLVDPSWESFVRGRIHTMAPESIEYILLKENNVVPWLVEIAANYTLEQAIGLSVV